MDELSPVPARAGGFRWERPELLRRRTSVKWRAHPADVLPVWVAEMDCVLAPPVARALANAVALGDTGYPAGTGYVEALAAFARARWGWDGVAPERTAHVPDVMRGVVELLRLVTEPGDQVVVNCPVYPPFYHFVRNSGRTVVEAPLGVDGRIDFAAAENRALFARLLAEHLPSLRYRPGAGTYLAWLDCRHAGLGEDPAAVLLDQGRVALTGGLPFGTGGVAHARFNLATSPQLIMEAVRRMATAL
jgi:bifunctional pyridoxal-dependent enzyme with beta-cystathionase and maltose regulon repressor activities